ncbi:4861_t:CDS:2, partial [Dentiscutata erythropus]
VSVYSHPLVSYLREWRRGLLEINDLQNLGLSGGVAFSGKTLLKLAINT